MSSLLLILNSASASTEKYISRENIMKTLQRFEYSAKSYLDERKKLRRSPHPQTFSSLHQWLISWLYFLWKLPLVIMFYTYIAPALYIIGRVTRFIALALKILSRRSSNVRHSVEHIVALIKIFDKIRRKIVTTEFSDLVLFGIITLLEILCTFLFPGQYDVAATEDPTELPGYELSELLSYEEIEDLELAAVENNNSYRRSIRMHHTIPLNPFKAKIRVFRTLDPVALIKSSTNHTVMNGGEDVSELGDSVNEEGTIVEASARTAIPTGEQYLDADSPASFPPTPFSRAVVMSRSSEHTASVMFAARDRLRVEALTLCRDEYSRMVAKEAQTSGQFAVFDHQQTSDGVALTCGNHCAIKIGKGQCCCSRSMMPIRTDTYVYFEFSINVSNGQLPVLGIGLSPPDCPLNVMVGSWPRSIGLYSDGQLLLGSRWYRKADGKKIEAGSTLGMLVHIPSVKPHQDDEEPKDDSTEEVTGLFSNWLKSFSTDTERRQSSKQGNDSPQIWSEGKISNPPHHVLSTSSLQSAEIQVPDDDGNKDPHVTLHYAINGDSVSLPEDVTRSLAEVVALRTPLYPTVSLFSRETRVWCRFCEADVVYRSRSAIGAPPGVRVYCLDGSLLLEEAD